MNSSADKKANRLIKEKSPYLLQHAYNPVDWYPWGEEAFEKARRENKPVLLSIGYSTCHWCHVMERESFENTDIAQLMNDTVVAIKVDREERPEIDQIYMAAVTALVGQGGWPLNVFLTPDKKPFYGGTYFPPEPRWGAAGFKDVLTSIHQAWQDRKAEIVTSSENLTDLLKTRDDSPEAVLLDEKVLETAYRQFSGFFDPRYGGFGQQPKFPTSHNLSFLLRYWKRTAEPKALQMVGKTLTEMYRGGMYDHLGGGFHRYSTDQEWQVPHFEKMLYDQAIISRTYLEAFQVTQNILYARVPREIFDYVLTQMRDPLGGFYSAEDADSFDPQEFLSHPDGIGIEKREGAFYLFSAAEIQEVLGADEAEIVNQYFSVLPNGNAKFDPHGEFVGKNILYLHQTLEEFASQRKRPVAELEPLIRTAKTKLLQVRAQRPRPHLDDKVLVDWNGLMIGALAFGGRVLNEPKYTEAAEAAAQFILKKLITPDGQLYHRYRDGEAAIPGTLSDYAFLINGLLDLYESTFKTEYFKQAGDLAGHMQKYFSDEAQGGFFSTGALNEELIFRQKEIYDGAIPSGNSLAALALVRLAHLTLDDGWGTHLEKLFKAFSHEISQRPSAYAQLLIAFDFWLGPASEITIAGKRDDPLTKQMFAVLSQEFLPNQVVQLNPAGEKDPVLHLLSPFLREQVPLEKKTTAYVCRNHVCQLPITDLPKFQQILNQMNPQ